MITPNPRLKVNVAEQLARSIVAAAHAPSPNLVGANESWSPVGGECLFQQPASPAVVAFARILNGAINKLPVHAGSVYRGIESRDLDALLAVHHYGATVAWPGFTSSTLDRGEAYAGDVLFVIQSRAGRKLGLYAHNHSEREVLFPAGTRFHITFVEQADDGAIIEVQEVTET